MKKFKFWIMVLGILLVAYFAVDITHGIQGLFVSKKGVQATKLTKTQKGSATNFVVNGSSSDDSELSDGVTVGDETGSGDSTGGAGTGTEISSSSIDFNAEKVKASLTPTLNTIFTKAVEVQNKTHVSKDSGKQQKSFDEKVVDDGTFNSIVTGMSIQTSGGSTMIIVNGKATSVNNKNGKYTFENIAISDVVQKGSFAQITGTFNYTVDSGKYSKQFNAFTDSNYSKITEINMQ